MASTKETQCTLAQEGSFEVVEHSDAVGHQCGEAITPLTETEKKVHELEKRLEEKSKDEKAVRSTTVVLMWIDMDEVVIDKHEGDTAIGGQASRPTATEAHERADKDFQEFKLWIGQHKNDSAVLDDVASFSQLELACLEKFDEGGASFERNPDVKLACQDKFYLALGEQRLRTVDKTEDKKKIRKIRREMLDIWTELIPQCEHIIIWHLTNDDYALANKYLRHYFSGPDKLVMAGASHLVPKLKHLVKKENCRAEGNIATSEPSATKPVSPGTREEKSPAGLQSKGSAILGSKKACSCGAKPNAIVPKTPASNIKDLKSTATHKDVVKPRGKETDNIDDDTDELTILQVNLFCAFVVCSIAGWLCGGCVAAWYIKTWVFGPFPYSSNR